MRFMFFSFWSWYVKGGKILLIKYNVLFKLSFPLGICESVAGLSPRGRRGYHSVRDFSCPVIFRSFRFAIW